MKYVKIKGKGNVFDSEIEGYLIPSEDDSIYVLKLKSGYNVAINKDNVLSLDVISEDVNAKSSNLKDSVSEFNPNLKKIAVIGMGGTIASSVNYLTGGVSPNFSSEKILESMPEAKGLANFECVSLRSILSENITLSDWECLYFKIREYVEKGFDGVVIAHGTDVMHYTSSMMSFLLEDLNIPVVFVGSQRSSDRPSSDSAYNFIGAIKFILETRKAGVFVCMHSNISDDILDIHLGVRCRKMHTSRRDAFKSINDLPIARVNLSMSSNKILESKIDLLDGYYNLFDVSEYNKENLITQKIELTNKVQIVKFYPNMDYTIVNNLLDRNDILIVEATGLGHVSDEFLSYIKDYKNKLIFVCAQTIFGRINLDIYSTGRKMKSLGIIGLQDMISEVAYTKAIYLYSKYDSLDDVKKFMIQNLRGEISKNSYLEEYF